MIYFHTHSTFLNSDLSFHTAKEFPNAQEKDITGNEEKIKAIMLNIVKEKCKAWGVSFEHLIIFEVYYIKQNNPDLSPNSPAVHITI